MIITLLLHATASGSAEEADSDKEAKKAKEEKETRAKAAAVKKWKKMFGESIDFAARGLYECMSYVHPQPDALMVDMDDKRVRGTSIEATTRIYLKPPCRLKKRDPDKYYLRKSDDEPSLLYYEWRKSKYVFRMYQSGNGMLLRIKPKGYDPRKPLTAKALTAVLYDVINMKYPSADKIADAFKLPETLPLGTVFTNAKMVNVYIVGNWEQHVVGFLSKEDICVMCFFSTANRMAFFFDFYPNWLDGDIFEKDGKTPVNPRKDDK
jgi:hypothetical protein